MTQHSSISKRNLIDKANTTVVVGTSAACFIVIFCLVASHALISQLAYQNRISNADKQTVSLLRANLSAVSALDSSYESFVSQPQNVLGGNPSGSGPQDGNNAKIVLDALPSEYDFPALATSLDSLLTSQGVTVTGITGTDEEATEDTTTPQSSPRPIAMPFSVVVTGNYQSIQKVIQAFDNSIRPIQVQTLNLSGSQAALTMTLTAQTFYQPAKSLSISTEAVK